MPGSYTATLSKVIDGVESELSGPVSFNVVPLRKGALEGASYDKIAAFGDKMESLQKDLSVTNYMLQNSMGRVKALQIALSRADEATGDLSKQLFDLNSRLTAINDEMNGNPAKNEIGERNNPTIQSRMFVAFRGMRTTYGPTQNHEASLDIAIADLAKMKPKQ